MYVVRWREQRRAVLEVAFLKVEISRLEKHRKGYSLFFRAVIRKSVFVIVVVIECLID